MKKKKNIRLEEWYSLSKTDNQIFRDWIKPSTFLKATYKECNNRARKPKDQFKTFDIYKKRVLCKSNVSYIKKNLQKGEKFGIPFLQLDQKGKPIGHEGRHTAQALKELGYKRIPVTIVKRRSREYKI